MNHNIKDKIKNHEFPFDENAWEKMEEILDNQPLKNKVISKIKTISIMICSLFFIAVMATYFNQPISETEISKPLIVEAIQNSISTEEEIANVFSADPIDKLPKEKPKIIQLLNGITTTTTNLNSLSITKDSLPELLAQQLSSPFNSQREKIYLHFDRTFFKPGEVIWFNAYLRNANDLLESQKSNVLYVELLAPNGSVEKKLTLTTKNGIAAGDFQLHPEAIGGQYKIKAYTQWQRNFEESFERDIIVQKNVLPNLRMKLDFDRKAYGSGDEAIANLELKTLDNEMLNDYEFSYTASLNGQQILKEKGKTNGLGKAKIAIDLPKKLNTNDGLINVLIDWKGQKESIARSIPIVLNKIDLQFMPEGGNIVVDLSSRVAFKALNEFGKPADIEGNILDVDGKIITSFKSYHQGMGAFDFIPNKGKTYAAKITKPEGITQIYQLPKALNRGAIFKLKTQEKEDLILDIASNLYQNLSFVLHNSVTSFYSKKLDFRQKETISNLAIPIKNLPAGIVQLTLFDENGLPLAERIVFLNPDNKLQFELKTDKENYLPREKVAMDILVKDEKGKPVSGQFSLAVADDQLLSFADDKQGNILATLWLESELNGEIIEPNFYFESPDKHPEKDQLLALDYLLMTQGWRRFDWTKNEELVANFQYPNEIRVVAGKVFDAWGLTSRRSRC